MKNIELLIEELIALAEPICQDQGIDLIDLTINYHRKTYQIEMLVDKPDGGISLDECANLNALIAGIIDAETSIGEDYSLQLASPGLDRPLTTEKDFRRALNRTVRLYLTDKYEGKQEWQGLLKNIEGTDIVLLKGEDELIVPLALIKKGMQVL